jgi:hypothetical protein
VTVGPKACAETLRTALAMGADAGIHVETDMRPDSDLQARGGELIVIDPRRSETAKIADRHIFVRPGSDAFLLIALLKTMKKDTAEIMRLGMQARKAGWKPGQKPVDAPPKKLPVAPTPARTATGGSAPRIPTTGRTKSGVTKDIRDVDDLAAAIERGEI